MSSCVQLCTVFVLKKYMTKFPNTLKIHLCRRRPEERIEEVVKLSIHKSLFVKTNLPYPRVTYLFTQNILLEVLRTF